MLNLKDMIHYFVEHRHEVVVRRTQFELRKAEERAHILEGYKIAQDNLDDFVRIIRASANRIEAKSNLVAKYTLSERQVNAILDLRLYQLTGMEREKIDAEYQELMTIISGLKEIIENEHILLSVIKTNKDVSNAIPIHFKNVCFQNVFQFKFFAILNLFFSTLNKTKII